MAQQRLAAVDLGAESGRVVVGRFDGAQVQLEEAHRFPNVPVRADGTLHWDILRLWGDIQAGLTQAAQGGPLDSIGVDTWGVDYGLLDKNDQLIGNPVHYRDSRHDGMMEQVFQTIPRQHVYASTGIQFMPFNTLFQIFAQHVQKSPQLDIAKTLLWIPDLLHFFLTGQKRNEYTIASTGQLLDARSRSFDAPLLQHLRMPDGLFAPMIFPGETLGMLRSDVAALTGLSPDTPIIAPGCHDTASAVAAVPAQGDDWAYLSSGTWSLMGIELPEPNLSDAAREAGFTNEGGAGGTIRFLKNIAGLWLVQECRRSFARAGREFSYAEMTVMAERAPAFGPIVEPDDPRFAAPADMPTALRDWCVQSGQPAPADEGALIRCCLESLALKYRWALEKLGELRGRPIQVLHIVGGGTQNRLLSRMAADCCQLPVVCGPVEATAVGNILLQAMGTGSVQNLSQLREIVRASFELETFEPDAGARGAWDGAWDRWLRAKDQIDR